VYLFSAVFCLFRVLAVNLVAVMGSNSTRRNAFLSGKLFVYWMFARLGECEVSRAETGKWFCLYGMNGNYMGQCKDGNFSTLRGVKLCHL